MTRDQLRARAGALYHWSEKAGTWQAEPTRMKRVRRRTDWREITEGADMIYRAAFGGERLNAWRVFVVPKVDARMVGKRRASVCIGYCRRSRRAIFLLPFAQHRQHGGWIETLVHEFIHARCPGLRHGQEFERLVAAGVARVWEGH